jgi:hypothetical protein
MAARKKIKEENETVLDDLEHNDSDSEDGRGCCYQPLLKTRTDPEAADRSPPRFADVLRDFQDERRTAGAELENRNLNCEPFQPRPRRCALPHFQTMSFLSGRGDWEKGILASRRVNSVIVVLTLLGTEHAAMLVVRLPG